MWDSFGDWTSYEVGNANSFWATRHSKFPQICNEETNGREENIGKDDTNGREQSSGKDEAILRLNRKGRKLTAALRNFTVTDFTEDRIDSYGNELGKIAELRDTFIGEVEDFLEDYEKEISFTVVLEWNDSMKEVENNVRSHALAIRKHAIKISARRKTRMEDKNRNLCLENEENNEAQAWAEAKYKAILDGNGDLDDVMPDDTADGEKQETVGEAMRQFRISKEIKKSLTLTTIEDTDLKYHIV